MRAEHARVDDSVLSDDLATEIGKSLSARMREFVHSHRWTWASFAAHGVMLLCLACMPPKSSALALDMLNEDVRYARYLAAPIETAPEPLSLQEVLGGDAPSDARHEGEEGEAGKPNASPKPRRMGGGGPNKPAVDIRAEARSAGILGVLPQSPTGGNGLFDRGQGYGYEPSEALGKLFGAELGDSSGFGSLGMRGTGRRGGGGVDGTVSVGTLNTGKDLGPGGYGTGHDGLGLRRTSHVPRVISHTAEVRGSLSKETIRRVIQRHLNEVRFCYEEALRKRPELAGRVQVAFMIAPSGVVQQAHVVDSSLQSTEADTCIASAVKRWTFPAPDGGGLVTVRYPFVLTQTGE